MSNLPPMLPSLDSRQFMSMVKADKEYECSAIIQGKEGHIYGELPLKPEKEDEYEKHHYSNLMENTVQVSII